MAEFVLKYADSRGQIHQQVAEAASEQELRERLAEQGYLIYWVRPRVGVESLARGWRRPNRISLEKFLVFNQQFVTLIRAGLPILKALDLLSGRTTDPKLGRWIQAVRDEVRNGALLSEAFRRQGVFPPVYISSILAGEKSGSLPEVLDRYIGYQKLALAVRKKLLVSLIYPSFLVFLVCCLVVFLVTYVVPNFAQLYESMQAELPRITQILIAVGTTARAYVVAGFLALVAAILAAFRLWAARESSRETLDRLKLRLPLAGEIWIKYQVAQLARVLSTLLTGGIPAGAGDANRGGIAGLRACCARRWPAPKNWCGKDSRFRPRCARQALLPELADRHDRGRGIHGRAARHAQQRGRVL
jgi:type IV pilus assembly protein PilC